jgi:excisionase family DNA binding protein
MASRRTSTAITRATPIDELPEILTVPETAAWLGVTSWLVYDLARRGMLPAIRFGRAVRIPRIGLAQLIGGQTGGR